MAATNVASSSSSSLYNKISNFSITHLPTRYSLLSKHPKALKLTTQFPNFPSLSFPSPFSRLPCASASFDGIELEEDETSSVEKEEEDPEAELEGEEEKEEERRKITGSGGDAGRLYVGNLPYSMNASQLNGIFAEAGNVVSVEVIYDRVTDRSRGFAFVTMGSVEEAQEAILKFDGTQIGSRTVKVNFPEVPRGGEREEMGPKIRESNRGYIDSPHKIYAGNLGWGLTSQDLRDAFDDQPGFLSAKVIYERGSGRSRGFGFVSFETAEAAQAAVDAMNGVEVEGRPLRLNMADERAPRPSPSASETVTEEDMDSSELFASLST
ncbi:hypothetical protein UlMin_005379 [Ulmus minor]